MICLYSQATKIYMWCFSYVPSYYCSIATFIIVCHILFFSRLCLNNVQKRPPFIWCLMLFLRVSDRLLACLLCVIIIFLCPLFTARAFTAFIMNSLLTRSLRHERFHTLTVLFCFRLPPNLQCLLTSRLLKATLWVDSWKNLMRWW